MMGAFVAGIGLIGVNGQPLVLKGINWFGYEVRIQQHMHPVP